jgi:hypothetical protein
MEHVKAEVSFFLGLRHALATALGEGSMNRHPSAMKNPPKRSIFLVEGDIHCPWRKKVDCKVVRPPD